MTENKHLGAFCDHYLEHAEVIQAWSDGYIGHVDSQGSQVQHIGIIIVTQKRAIFFKHGWFNTLLVSVAMKDIVALDHSHLMGNHKISLRTRNRTLSVSCANDAADHKILAALKANLPHLAASEKVLV